MRVLKPALSQSGAALIIFLNMLILGATTILLSQFNHTNFQIKNQKQTAKVLAQAKDALLGFALTYGDVKTHLGQMQGYLPCPDFDGDGSADSACSSKGSSVIGRLPWKTLGLPPLRDGSGECLWYAISGSYKDNPKKILTNMTAGLLIVKDAKGYTIADKVIAIIFAPGRTIEGQNRSATANNATECGSSIIKFPVDPINNVQNYLDHYNINGININNATGNGTFFYEPSHSGKSGFFATREQPHTATFIKAPLTKINTDSPNVIFNDILMLITRKDFAPVYERMNYWVAKRVASCLESYANSNDGKYPWASKLNPFDYTDDIGERFGRIPNAPLNTHTTNANMANEWPLDHKRRCFNENASLGDWKWGWWKEWKEMVFFAVNLANSPPVNATGDTLSLTINISQTKNVKLIVLVAGSPLNGQTRTAKTNITNYLEGKNADGDEHFIKQLSSSDFNDVVCWEDCVP